METSLVGEIDLGAIPPKDLKGNLIQDPMRTRDQNGTNEQ